MTRFSTFSGPRKPLAKVSAKKLRQDAELDVSRAIVSERARGLCEVRLAGCNIRGAHAHHVLPRSIRVDHSPNNLLWTCWTCHRNIHRDPRKARALGLLTSAPSPSAADAAESLGVDS